MVFVNGEHDRPERSRRFAERLPHSSFHRIGGVGHYLPLEAPETLARITADVLASATWPVSPGARYRAPDSPTPGQFLVCGAARAEHCTFAEPDRRFWQSLPRFGSLTPCRQ